MSKKISLNPKYTNNSGNRWSTTTYNDLEYYISTNKSHLSVSTLKCEFTTPYDNIDVVIEIASSSENNYDWCYVGKLDDSSAAYDNYLDRISGFVGYYYPTFKEVTINVAKAGTHFLIIGYRKDSSGSDGNDCGYFRLITTEVEKQKNQYIYCGTKTTSAKDPIVFTKTESIGFKDFDSDLYQWKCPISDDYHKAKILFTTYTDNVVININYLYKFYMDPDKFIASNVDEDLHYNSNDCVYVATGRDSVEDRVTKQITIPKAGVHYILFYSVVKFSPYDYLYVGLTGIDTITTTKTLLPKSIFVNNKDIGEVYVGSELIWEKSKYLWCFSPYLYNITWSNRFERGQSISYEEMTYDKFDNSRTIIPGVTHNYPTTYYGFNVKDLVKNGYLYLYPYDRSMDMSVIPNPVDMYRRYTANNCARQCNYLKINTKLKKETTSLANTFEFFGSDIETNPNVHFPVFDEPLIYEHKACNIAGLDKLNTDNITYMGNMFTGARVVGNLDFSNWNTSKVTNMSYMFYGSKGKNRCKYSNKYLLENYSYLTGLNNWNLQSVKDMNYMFRGCTYYDFQDKELTWNTSNVTDMSSMFENCNAYNFPKLSFDTRNVTNMAYMFTGFESYNDLKLNFTDTSKVTYMYYMFSGCSALSTLDVSKWDVSNVTRMDGMFSGCSALSKLDVSKWNVSNIKDDSMYSFVYKCKELTTLIDGHESDPNVVALNGLKKTINLLESTKLNYESVYALFRGLATVTTTQTIYLPKVMEGKLDAAKVKIATDKGWTIKYS